MVEVTKSDWKLFVEKLPLWQERYMECLLQEYAAIIAKTDEASTRFWELKERIDTDRKNPGVQLAPRKSEMMADLLIPGAYGTLNDFMRTNGLVHDEDGVNSCFETDGERMDAYIAGK